MTRLFTAVFGGAIAWSLHLLLSYLVVGLACRPRQPLLPADDGLVTGILLGVSVAAALGAAASAVLAARLWRRADGREPGARGSRRGMAFVGLLLNLVFLTTIVVGASAAFVLPAC